MLPEKKNEIEYIDPSPVIHSMSGRQNSNWKWYDVFRDRISRAYHQSYMANPMGNEYRSLILNEVKFGKVES